MNKQKILCNMCIITLIISLSGCNIVQEALDTVQDNINAGIDLNANNTANGEAKMSIGENLGVSTNYNFDNFNTEEYNNINESGFIKVSTQPLSTFAADVDTGSYCNFRRFINNNDLNIPSGAIRTEEMINYFDYDVIDISDGKFTVNSEIQKCPWNNQNQLLMMTVQANPINIKNKGNNFVYLIDTSGSMASEDKIDLVYDSFEKLTSTLTQSDKVSIVTYAGDTTTLLEGCNGSNHDEIDNAVKRARDITYNYGGGTNGSGGIEKAYEVALNNFIDNGNNRVIIASDGDMNLGISDQSGLVDLIKKKKESGIFLTTLGYGSGNYSDANMEQIADAGNGNYYYIDCVQEAEHVLVEKLKETTVTVAKDVKLQVEFNPSKVYEYRLIGYENRTMAADEFENDTKDGGEVGAGQQITVFYELNTNIVETADSGLKYQEKAPLSNNANSNEWLTLSINYKELNEDKSQTEKYPVEYKKTQMSEDFSFGIGIIETSMLIRNSNYLNDITFDDAISFAKNGTKNNNYRNEFVNLIEKLK